MEGRDALGILPTGGGKSVCFQLPAFLLKGMVLVVSPLISLMEDQMGRARQAGLRADLLNSALPAADAREVLHRARSGETRLLLVAPERFQVPAFRSLLGSLPVSLLAVDEAHCISQWGHDFRPSYLRIGEVRPLLGVPVLALTATATPRVREEISRSLGLMDPVRVVGSFDRPNLAWEVRPGEGHRNKVRASLELLRGREGATILYASTRRGVEATRRALAVLGYPALAYHAGLTPEGRSGVQERFLNDPAPVVVATNAFGMGIDRSDVRLVVHYQLPGSLEGYYQEAGRAGRDGEASRCIALFGSRDRGVHDRFVAGAYPSQKALRALHGHLMKWLGPGGVGEVSLAAVGRSLGKGVGEEEAYGALRALARCGALELDDASAPEGSGRAFLTLRGGNPDLAALEPLRRAARAQVESVQSYARARSCRRKFLLEYFGERVDGGGCGRCDRCRRASGGGGWRLRALFGGAASP